MNVHMKGNTMQDKLDAATKELRRAIKAIDRIAAEAGDAADDLCKGGDNGTSAAIRAIEADLRAGAASLTAAYAKGRALVIPSGGGLIQPMSGGK